MLSRNLKILIVSQYYYPDVTAAAFRIKEIADILVSNGYEITVITTKPHKAKPGESSNITDETVKIIRLPIINIKEKNKLNYIMHYLSFMIMAIFSYLLKANFKYDLVFSTSPPLFVGVAGYFISKINRSQFLLDIRDIWPDSAVVTGQLTRESKLYKLGCKVEQWLYRQADLITCVARPMAEYIAKYTERRKVAVIYNGVPEKYIISTSCTDTEYSFPNDKFIILYVGNMGFAQNLKIVMELARKIKDEMNDVMFYLIGEGTEKSMLIKLKDKYALDNVVIDGPVNKLSAFCLMKMSSALFLQLKDDPVMEKTVPSKVFDYMTAGKPILFGIKGEGREILSQVMGNIYVEPDSIDSLINVIIILKKDYEKLAEYAKQNIVIVKKYYTREQMVTILERHIHGLPV